MDIKDLLFLQSIGIKPQTPLYIVEDKVAQYLEINGFDEDYNITESGRICENILDYIGDIQKEDNKTNRE